MQKVLSPNVLINYQCFNLRLLFVIYTLLTKLTEKFSNVDILSVKMPLVTKVFAYLYRQTAQNPFLNARQNF